MDLRRTLSLAASTLSDSKIDHALIGGFALAVYGVNRATADIDLLADGSKLDLIKTQLIQAGFSLVHESKEVLQFTGIGQLDVLLANRPLSLRMISDAKVTDRLPVRVLSAEDLIGLKIQAYRNDPSRELRDKADIQALIQSTAQLDWDRIKIYADLFGEWPTVSALRGPR